MPSPFPGMNPYLEKEAYWQDFHQTFIPTIRAMLATQVAPHYFVRVEQYVFLHELPGEERRPLGGPAVHVKDTRPRDSASGTATIAPAYGYLPTTSVDQEVHSYLTIRDREGHNVVTVIELLSPSNKNFGADRDDYLKKRRAFFLAGTHVVEIDLLRGGPRLPLNDVPKCDYLVAVSRTEERPRVGLWPVQLRQRLPQIPIPLRSPDPDAELDLQEAIDRVYDSAGYAPLLYETPPQPPLNEADVHWARQFVPA
jgi:hypothetical protein